MPNPNPAGPTTKHLLGQTQTLPIQSLKPAEYNPRKISKEALARLQESIQTLGYAEPIVVNKDLTVISGHQRLKALTAMGVIEVDVLVVDLDKRKEKLLNIALNSRGLIGEWDIPQLEAILKTLEPTEEEQRALGIGDEGDPILNRAIQHAMQSPMTELPTLTDLIPNQSPSICQPGFAYRLGKHGILVCGSSTDPQSWNGLQMLDGWKEQTLTAFTSPPYNVDMEYEKGMTQAEHLELIRGVAKNLIPNLSPKAILGWQVGYSRDSFLLGLHYPILAQDPRTHFRDLLIWHKQGYTAMHRISTLYHNAKTSYYYPNQMDEFLLVLQMDQVGPHELTSEVNLEWATKDFSSQTWAIQCSGSKTESMGHPAPFPVELPQTFVRLYAPKGSIVADPFSGSGSTIIAAALNERRGFGIELSPQYCDITIARMLQLGLVKEGEVESRPLRPNSP